MIRVGVIGCGLIGRERLDAVKKLAAKGLPVTVGGVFDASAELTQKAATDYQALAHESLDALLAADYDLVVIALPHDLTVQIALKALQGRGNVLVEKPMGRDLKEAKQLIDAGGDRLKIGFNYRFYPGIRQAIKDARSGRFGEVITIEFLLGHGCFPGQEKTWKLNAERAGGGCLIDPGIHLLDLCLLLAPEGLEVAGGSSWSGFWKTGIEEDVNLILRGKHMSISLHVSIVHWRSVFKMAVHGTDGYGVVTGRNRSYGPQSYTVGPRWGWQSAASQAASEKVELETDGMDVFADEMESLLFPSEGADASWPRAATSADALRVMQLLDNIREELGLRREF
jgi:1,5-anhydro-D-fructose reductase (1,5-anhydro-D-mannitol-forming)